MLNKILRFTLVALTCTNLSFGGFNTPEEVIQHYYKSVGSIRLINSDKIAAFSALSQSEKESFMLLIDSWIKNNSSNLDQKNLDALNNLKISFTPMISNGAGTSSAHTHTNPPRSEEFEPQQSEPIQSLTRPNTERHRTTFNELVTEYFSVEMHNDTNIYIPKPDIRERLKNQYNLSIKNKEGIVSFVDKILTMQASLSTETVDADSIANIIFMVYKDFYPDPNNTNALNYRRAKILAQSTIYKTYMDTNTSEVTKKQLQSIIRKWETATGIDFRTITEPTTLVLVSCKAKKYIKLLNLGILLLTKKREGIKLTPRALQERVDEKWNPQAPIDLTNINLNLDLSANNREYLTICIKGIFFGKDPQVLYNEAQFIHHFYQATNHYVIKPYIHPHIKSYLYPAIKSVKYLKKLKSNYKKISYLGLLWGCLYSYTDGALSLTEFIGLSIYYLCLLV